MIDDIRRIISELSTDDKAKIESGEETRSWVQGSYQQRARIAAIAEYCADLYPGDFIEIGCLHGGTTIHLTPIAEKYGRRIICVDPWLSRCPLTGTDYGTDPFEIFKQTMLQWWDILDIIKTSSMDQDTITAIQARPLCFAFVDGMHTYEATISDIEAVAHCAGIIAVDDLLWNPDVRRAYDDGAVMFGRQKIFSDCMREGYLCPKYITTPTKK